MGRKKLDKKRCTIQIRVEENEANLVQKAADIKGLKLSAYIRNVLFKDALKVVDHSDFKDDKECPHEEFLKVSELYLKDNKNDVVTINTEF